MRILIIILLAIISYPALSQGPVDRIELGYATTKRGIEWTRPGLPTHVPVFRISRDTNTIIWHDKNTGMRYEWDYLTSVWYARGRFSSSLPPLPTQTSGLATIDNRTGFWLNASNILHRYDITQTAWVPLKITYQSAAPTNVASGGGNGAAVYTTTLWQDSDDFLIRFWDGDSWELIGGGTDLTFSGASSPVTLNSSTGTDVTFTAGTGISLAATGTDLTISGTAAGLSKWTDAGAYTYLTSTTDRALVGSSTELNTGYILQANGGFFAKGTGSTSSTFTTQLHNSTGSNNGFLLRDDGNAAFGTTVGTERLKVFGGEVLFQYAGGQQLRFTDGALRASSSMYYDTQSGNIFFRPNLLTAMTITTGQRVGIGTSSPSQLLHVEGTARITGSDGTSTTIMGRDGDGDISALALSGMSISAGTLTATDGSITNELQTISNTYDATSHTATLSNSGGSTQFVEGSGITLTTTGTGLNGIVTIAATSSATDLTFSGASSPVTLNSSTGTDVTFTAGGINSFSATGTNITITATEVDGSTTNELQTIANTSNSTSHTATLSNSGGSLQIIEGAGVLLTTGGTGLNGTVTIEAIDQSTTNEIQTYSASGAGPTSYDMTVSSGGTVTLAEGSGIDLTRSGNTITFASTGLTSATGYVNGGNSFGALATIGLNDNFDWAFETNGTNRMWIDNTGPVTIGATRLIDAALNINLLQNNTGLYISGGSGLGNPFFIQTRGNGSGSNCTVLDAEHSMINGNVEATITNTATTGTGGALLSLFTAPGSTGDPRIHFGISATTDWSIGIDNDDVDNLKIHRFASPSDNNGVGTLEFGYDGTSLGLALNKVGIGISTNNHYAIDAFGKFRADQFANNSGASVTTGTYALGTAAGTSPTLSGSSEFWGNGGRLIFTSGTSPTTNGVICTVTLGTEYTFAECAPIMQGRTTNTGGFDYVGTFNSGTRVITYTLIGTLTASTAYEFNLIISGRN